MSLCDISKEVIKKQTEVLNVSREGYTLISGLPQSIVTIKTLPNTNSEPKSTKHINIQTIMSKS